MSHTAHTSKFFIVASHHYWLQSRLDRRAHLQQEDALIGCDQESAIQEEEQQEYALELEA